MFERFTPKARQSVVVAQEEARALGHAFIGTEHVLLGVLAGDGIGKLVLVDLGVTYDSARARISSMLDERGVGGGDTAASGGKKKKSKLLGDHVPFTPRSKQVLELGLREAMQFGHNYIGTEHIVLALSREGTGLAAEVLAEQGVVYADLRSGVLQELARRRLGAGAETPKRVARGRLRQRAMPAEHRVMVAIDGDDPPGDHDPSSVDVMLGLLADEGSAAAKALTGLGVDLDAVRAALAEVDPTGTTDEPSSQAFARTVELSATGSSVSMTFESADIAAEVCRLAGGADPATVLRDAVIGLADLHDLLLAGLHSVEPADESDD